MIACIAPSDRFFEENISTLNYATRASYIANAPTKNIDPKIKEIQELKKQKHTLEIELKAERQLRGLLQDQLKLANDHIEYLTKLTNEPLKEFGKDLINENIQIAADNLL